MRISDWSSDVCSSDLSHIPFYFGISNDDTLAEHSKRPAETIHPLDDFASFLMNIHIKACRKQVWGTTYYNHSAADNLFVQDGVVAARVPIKAHRLNTEISILVYYDSVHLYTIQNT